MRRRPTASRRRPAALLVAAVVTATAVASPVAAAPGDGGVAAGQARGDSDGSTLGAVAISVTLTGNGVGSGGPSGGGGGSATRTISKPPACYWDGPLYDGESFLGSYGPGTRGSLNNEVVPTDIVEQLSTEAGGWYVLVGQTAQGQDLSGASSGSFDYTAATRACKDTLRAGATGGPSSEWLWVPEGQAPPPPPPPVVTAEELLQIAQEAITVPEPDVETNPTARGYVSLPSWLWVTDGADAADGFVPVEITATAGASSATVRAEPDLFTARSATGSASCAAEAARTAWAPGAADAAGCTLTPQRSSAGQPGGFDVRTTTSYTVSWDGVTDGTPVAGGALTPITRTSALALDVAEVQSLVTRGR
ncbi:hypothetical protein [Pseudokineococcus lusitanus]|uniref:hypothetical protein n=1 Tax=Pseudokineococcus lusitanus TaxID=763993 RepID=UPI0011CE9716|nr:hypothetical protein [Pseudokineococcus lusitanus]